jgi:hypothetical protein
VVKLHAQGLVKFGDPERILEVVTRTKDKTILLSRDEARVLSAIPDAYATNATKIRLAVLLPDKSVQQILIALLRGTLSQRRMDLLIKQSIRSLRLG